MSYLYVIKDETGRYKVGSGSDPDDRKSELQTGNAEVLKVVARYESDHAPKIEKIVQEKLSAWKQSGEWFTVPLDHILATIDTVCDNFVVHPVLFSPNGKSGNPFGNIVSREMLWTPEMSSEVLDNRNGVNRPISDQWAERFTAWMRDGKWGVDPNPIMFGPEGLPPDKQHLFDGQKRLTAIVRSGKSQWFKTEYNWPPEHMNHLDLGQRRTGRDQLRMTECKNANQVAALVTLWSKYLAVDRRTSRMLVGGGTSSGLRRSDLLPHEYPRIVDDYPFLNKSAYVAKAPGATLSGWLKSTKFAAFVHAALFERDEEMADSFERECLMMQGWSDGHPFQALLRALTNMRGGANKHTVKLPVEFGLLIKATNFWISGRLVKVLRYDGIDDLRIK